jgi:hypothetical protein
MYRWARFGAAGAGATAAALCIPTTSSVSSTADLETTPSRTAVRHGQGQGQVQQALPWTSHRWFPRLRSGWAVAACDAADGSAAAVEPIELTRVDTELPRWAG